MNAIRGVLSRAICNRLVGASLCVALWVAAPYMPEATRQMVSFAIINILLANSINVLTGMAGQISLGQAAFMGIAAYTSVLLVKSEILPLWLSIGCGTLLAMAVGGLLSFPAGRVREFYLAMMTLAFGMIFIELMRDLEPITGGVLGITGIPSPSLRNLEVFGLPVTTTGYLRLLVAIGGAALFALDRFTRSRFGRAYFAVHESELAARSIGIRSDAIKRQAYLISAFLAGLAGALYGHLVSYIGPESFELQRSIEILVMSVIGGLGSLAGQVLGAVALTWLPLQLEVFADFKFIIYGALLVGVFIVMPRGLAGLLFLPPRVVERRLLAAVRAVPIDSTPAIRRRAAGELVLSWRNLRRDFAGLRAVSDFSFDLYTGKVVALVGPNGSGKSTTVNVLAGLYPPSAGKILLRGESIAGLSSDAIARRGMVRTFQDPRLIGHFTILENTLLGGHLKYRYGLFEAMTGLGRMSGDERAALRRAESVLAFMGLTDVRDRVLEILPYGYRRLVEVARALMVEPDVILLDEPAAGLSDFEIERLASVIQTLRARGVAVLIIDHHMDFLADIADSVVVLDSGAEIYRGDMEGMRRDERVAECYLGKLPADA
jgi:ABC-type branched-subunit amino acid transport system ATPase component/ABC-type branched-subunit amino acid transport system permease subunit